MARVWFNKTFSSVHSVFSLIREADAGGEFHIVCSSPNPHAIALLAAHEAAAEPSGITGTDYIDWCLSFCKERSIDIFVPGKEASLIARHRDTFGERGVSVLSAAAPETLDLLHDKARFYATAEASTAPSPEVSVFTDISSFLSAYRQMHTRHPVLCMKPSVSVYGIGFRVIDETRNAFDLLLDGATYRIDMESLCAALERAGTFRPMLLMPYLASHEYSVDCVAHDGRLLCAVARRKSLAAGGGQTIVVREDIERACADLVSQFQLNGNVNIQFREGDEGLRILEINPRMSGGIGMACLGGPNLPYLALQSFVHGPDVTIPSIQDGTRVGEINKAVRLPG